MNNVLVLRKARAMTQDEFAEFCNISRISIARYEASGNISRAGAEKIAAACGVSVSLVLGDDSEKKEAPIMSELRASLVDLMMDLSPEEEAQVRAFVAGMRAGRKP